MEIVNSWEKNFEKLWKIFKLGQIEISMVSKLTLKITFGN